MSCNEWKEYTLDEVCISITDGSHSSPKSVENGYPMASVKDMGYFEINIDSCRQISEEDYQKLVNGKCKPEINDVLIAKDGSYMKFVNVVKEEKDLVLLSSIAILKPNIDILNPLFLKYYLLTPNVKHELEYGYVSGSAIRRIVLKDFKRFPIKLPPSEEQEKIANILSSLDDKIELNNEMNKTLEEMAQSIFKRWFVDFEFPNEDGEPYKSSGGEMVDSEFGMIPNGWEVKNLDEVLELIIDYRGKTPKKLGSDWSDEGIMALSAKHIKDGNLVNLEVIKYVSNELYEKWMKDKLKMGDIIMTSEAPVGELYYINTNTEYCLSQRVYGLRSNKNILKSSLLYYMLDSKHVKGQILNRSTGTTVVGIRQTELRKVNVIVPPMNIQESISILLDKILSKKEILDNENTNLAQIRNSILPKLMNGEIKIGI